jgi:hypothetical protein
METGNKQRLLDWVPLTELEGKTPSFGDISIDSPSQQRLSLTLPYEEGTLRIEFKDVRAFMTTWDGDRNPFLTLEEAVSRPSDMCKVEASRWLSSGYFSRDIESSLRASEMPWEHFCILSGARSVHVAARDDVEASWVAE